MAESSTVTALRSKRDELERIISSYETAITVAKRDLAHVNATLELFERHGAAAVYPSRLSIVRMFKRGEIFELCKTALSVSPQCLDTRELALYVIRAKGMDENDTILRKAIGFRIVQIMLRQRARGRIATAGRRRGVKIWALAEIESLVI
ncbi:MAG: hypothetical protein CR217_00600 [Beijerinckiaceae bacterium]|nr:MAG: hypothetical protein CR217_00600 [Beijerinckiaceae bacterium]